MNCRITVVAFVALIAPFVSAESDDTAQIDAIYGEFFKSTIDVEKISSLYADGIIHVGRPEQALVRGKTEYLARNVTPMAGMINSGEMSFTGRAYIVRRLVVGDMANDVGYLYARVEKKDGSARERLQKFSWVFVREDGRWRVVTDFDASPAPMSVLDSLEPQIVLQ